MTQKSLSKRGEMAMLPDPFWPQGEFHSLNYPRSFLNRSSWSGLKQFKFHQCKKPAGPEQPRGLNNLSMIADRSAGGLSQRNH